MAFISHRSLLAASALTGAVLTHFLLLRTLPISEAFAWDNVDRGWVLVGAISGVVLGHLGWVAANPLRRLSRAAAFCALANVAVWVAFIALTPPVEDSEFQRIAAERRQLDAGSGPITFVTDVPTILAGRWHGTFGAVNFPDRLLSLFNLGAAGFVELLVVSPRYMGAGPTRGESFAIAGVAFILTTAFWIAFGGAISALRRLWP